LLDPLQPGDDNTVNAHSFNAFHNGVLVPHLVPRDNAMAGNGQDSLPVKLLDKFIFIEFSPVRLLGHPNHQDIGKFFLAKFRVFPLTGYFAGGTGV
jgi:hypothetical protein